MTLNPVRVVPSKDAMFRVMDDEAVILDLASATYFGLNAVGASFWKLLCENPSFTDAVSALLNEYDVDESTLTQDLEALVAELSHAGLVRVDSASANDTD